MKLINSLFLTYNVKNWLVNSHQPKVLHVFDEVCNLVNERKEVLSIVNLEIGNGPFSLVVEATILFTRHLNSESKVSIQDKQIFLEDLTISFANAQIWNPLPKWEELRKSKDEIVNRLALVQIDNENDSILKFTNALSLAIINVDIPNIKIISSKLSGLGIGLTPAGDDILMGAMYAAWVIHQQDVAKNITSEMANIAIPLTTTLSGAWLRSAAKGEAGELWHEFFDALIEDKNIYLPMSKILSVGETSGSDALSGFLSIINEYKSSLSGM